MQTFTRNVIQVIEKIPYGKVTTYGRIARIAGKAGGARQVSRLLHSMSQKYALPWHRVINAQGMISLKPSQGYELQMALLQSEGVTFNSRGQVDFDQYLWRP